MPALRTLLKALLPPSLCQRTLRPAPGPDRVLLTFDDGPHPQVTPLVLDALRAYGAQAVFFVVGHRAEQEPGLLRRILEEGHLLGNHTDTHCDAREVRFGRYYRDLRRCQERVLRHTGTTPALFRPPFGRLTPASLLAPRLAGLRTVLWSIDPGDWRCRTAQEARAAAQRILEAAGPGDIVLLHDDNPCAGPLLDALLPGLCRRQLDPGAAPLLRPRTHQLTFIGPGSRCS